jgi:HK97 family phage portal protein
MGIYRTVSKFFGTDKREATPTPVYILDDPRLWTPIGADGNPCSTDNDIIGLPAVLCALRTISENIGFLPLDLYKRDANGGKSKAKDHPVYRLLRNAPNSYQTALDFKSSMTGSMLLYGNAYAVINRSLRGEVLSLVQLDSNTVSIKWEDGQPVYVHKPNSKKTFKYSADQIFHLKGFSLQGLQGLSPIDICKDTLESAVSLNKFTKSFFKNGTWLGATFEVPSTDGMTEEEEKAFETKLTEMHKGASNAHKPLILKNGLKYETRTADPEKAQALETRLFLVQDVARIFNIPPHLLFDMSNSTSSNIEEQSLIFKQALLPIATKWVENVWLKLLLSNEQPLYFADFNFDKLLQVSGLEKQQSYQIAVNTGTMTRNEVRAKENMGALQTPAGDWVMTRINEIPDTLAEGYYKKTAAPEKRTEDTTDTTDTEEKTDGND